MWTPRARANLLVNARGFCSFAQSDLRSIKLTSAIPKWVFRRCIERIKSRDYLAAQNESRVSSNRRGKLNFRFFLSLGALSEVVAKVAQATSVPRLKPWTWELNSLCLLVVGHGRCNSQFIAACENECGEEGNGTKFTVQQTAMTIR